MASGHSSGYSQQAACTPTAFHFQFQLTPYCTNHWASLSHSSNPQSLIIVVPACCPMVGVPLGVFCVPAWQQARTGVCSFAYLSHYFPAGSVTHHKVFIQGGRTVLVVTDNLSLMNSHYHAWHVFFNPRSAFPYKQPEIHSFSFIN